MQADSKQPDPLTTVKQEIERVDSGGVAVGVINAAADANIYMGGQRIVETRPDFLYTAVPPMIRRLLGREELVDALITRLAGGEALLAAHGLPGVGKTTLAVALAHHKGVLDHFSGGVLWGALGQTPDNAGVQAIWSGALLIPNFNELPPAQKLPRLSQAVSELRRPVLVILDDAWTLEAAQALQLGAPNITHLLTTRNWSLATRFAGASGTLPIPELAAEPSHALLEALAPGAWASDPSAAAALAGDAGGLPLALELLGGFLVAPERMLFPDLAQQAFAELADPAARLELAARRLGDLGGTQQTLAGTIRLSLDDLQATSPAAVEAFFALGAFAPKPARFERDAAIAVSGAGSTELALLAARSLLEIDEEAQLALHQVVADVARTEMAEEAAVAHRDHYLGLANENNEDWQAIEQIYAQIKFAWQQFADRDTPENNLAQFVWAMRIYQERRGLWEDKLSWAERALDGARKNEDQKTAASMLINIGYVYDALGEKQQALDKYNEALPLYRQVGDKGGEATTLNNIGGVYSALGEKQQALDKYNEALPLYR
jgi:tetratricopeptide (TPR) repeat protein